MPLRKPEDEATDAAVPETAAGNKFPPEAYNYDSDVSDAVVSRVQAAADKILCREKWVVIDGVGKR
jgi:hypothetical protein